LIVLKSSKSLSKLEGLNVLVTGADGFVPSHLCELLANNQSNVTALIKRNSSGFFKNIDHIKNKVKVVWADTQDPNRLIDVTKNVDIIFHLAAQSHVGHSLHNPYETVMNDISSTLNVLEAARKNDVKRVVHAGSSEIYGKPIQVPIDESHPLNPRSPYAAAKASSEHLLQSYFHTYGLPVVMSRFFNIFGPKQGLDQVMPKFILQALNNKNITIYGDGNQTRDYTYVSDAVKAYSLLGVTPGIEGKVINFGSGRELKVKDIAKLILTLTNSKSKLTFDRKLRSGETPKLLCNTSNAKKLLKWQTNVDFETGLKETIDYFLSRKDLVSNLPFML
jgi:dTDP-glucose 4,6-dehydratase